MAKIKGTAIRGALKFVKESDSPHEIPDVLEKLPDSVAPVYEQRILAADWYPYEAYAELLRVLDEKIGRGDLSLMPELGRFGAQRDIRGVLKIIATFSSVEKLIARGDWFWNRYCDTGDSVVLESDSGRAVMALKDFPGIAIQHCHLLTGWLEGLSSAVGGKAVRVVKTRCVHRGDPWCQWDARWS